MRTDLSKLPIERETHRVGSDTREQVVDGHDLTPLSARQISFVGLSDAGAGFEFATAGWRFGQVLVCTGGRGQVRVGADWVECGEGMAYLTPALAPHAYRSVRGARWQLAWVTYDAPHDRTPLHDLDGATLVRVDPRPIHHLVAALYFVQQQDAGNVSLVESIADAIEQAAYRCTPAHGDAGRLWPVWQAVDQDLARPWSVEELGELIGVSGEHLRRLCVRHLRRAPMEQVTFMRMRRAASLLRSTPLKIDVVAEQVGYADRFGFAAAFRRVYRTSPAKFRRVSAGQGTDER